MKSLDIKEVSIEPDFDIELFMFLSQQETISGEVMATAIDQWGRWSEQLHCYQMSGGRKGYITIFLDHKVEDEIDALWEKKPSEAFTSEALAQTMIMSSLRNFFPDLTRSDCAPLPIPNKLLKRALAKKNVILHENGTINRKYSTLTYYPRKDGCEKCFMKDTCPKRIDWTGSNLAGLVNTP